MMATYFHGGSEIQSASSAAAAGGGDQNLQTLYLMNPNFVTPYSEVQTCTPPSMLFLNPSNSLIPHAPSAQQQQQLIGIPLGGAQDHCRPSPPCNSQLQHHAALHGLSVSRVHPNLWSPVNNPLTPSHSQSGGDLMGFHRRPMAPQSEGLSLSLSPGMQMHPCPSPNQVTDGVIPSSKYLTAAQQLLEEVVRVANNTNKCIPHNRDNDNPGVANSNAIVDSHNTGDSSVAHKEKAKAITREHYSSTASAVEGSTTKAAELSTAQRQELQMKKAKLLNILDEVEQRYRQYNAQMQVVVSSFEQAAGSGSAKLYTSLALNTISKQFRCLKDSILSQIKSTTKSLGEEDINANAGVKLEGGAGSRLRFVDHQLRQQRALQQLGMMQHSAWRPQRGLPERAVSVLRAWLFEHFLHPYPKDSDKHMLAKQTGLTRSQVSNWFINARVRLWKPMVEEMYLEEIKSQEQNSGNSEDNNNSAVNKNSNSSKTDMTSTIKEAVVGQHQDHGIVQGQPQQQQQQQQKTDQNMTNDMISNISASSSQGFTLIGSSSDMDSLMGRSPKNQRSNSDMQNSSPSSILSMDMEMKQVDQHQQRHSLLMTNHHGDAAGTGFNPYIVNDMAERSPYNPDQMTAQPYHGNTVSLTLGLPYCDNVSLGNHHQNFLSNHQAIPMGRRLDNIGATADSDFCGISMAQPSHPSNNGYESIDIQNRKRFAAQILHDFVAS